MANIGVKDGSGDRNYFTIIPNYILNHSTMWDRETYVQMKRIAGEDGTCWASRETIAKQCGMSPRRLDKSIKYLLDHKWISFIGKRSVITSGGVQSVNEYKIADLWRMNVDYYESQRGSTKNHTLDKRGSTKRQKGVAPCATKEEPREEEITFLSENERRRIKDLEVRRLCQ